MSQDLGSFAPSNQVRRRSSLPLRPTPELPLVHLGQRYPSQVAAGAKAALQARPCNALLSLSW